MTYIPDPIERGEARAESAYDAMLQPDGRLKCGCGNIFDPKTEGGPVSPDPYAMPVCGKCLHARELEVELNHWRAIARALAENGGGLGRYDAIKYSEAIEQYKHYSALKTQPAAPPAQETPILRTS